MKIVSIFILQKKKIGKTNLECILKQKPPFYYKNYISAL